MVFAWELRMIRSLEFFSQPVIAFVMSDGSLEFVFHGFAEFRIYLAKPALPRLAPEGKDLDKRRPLADDHAGPRTHQAQRWKIDFPVIGVGFHDPGDVLERKLKPAIERLYEKA